MFPKFFSTIQGVKDDYFCPYLPFFNYFINFMALQHITKRVGKPFC